MVEGTGRADLWSVEACLNREDMDVPVYEGGGVGADADVAELFVASMDAVAMDNRERTRSSGYVVPTQKLALKKTERMSGRATSQRGRTDRSDAS